MRVERITTPIGEMYAASDDGALVALTFDERWTDFAPRSNVGDRVARYFDGDLAAFDGLTLAPRGTPFQMRVWRELRAIAAGETIAYATLAARIGAPGSSRAVGAANAKNPIAIAIPCHRVIRSDGDLCGYAGGVDRKRWLLAHERARAQVAGPSLKEAFCRA